MSDLEGVRRLDGDVVELDAAVDPQVVLDRARAAGAVVRFGRRRATLAELFREAVADDPEEQR